MTITYKYKIAIGGISTECSTYSPLLQNKENFEIIEKEALKNLIDFPFEKNNLKLIPIFLCKSIPGGPIELDFYTKIKKKFIKKLQNLLPLDGIILIMHGAMNVPGIEDPEGQWIEEIRKVIGKNSYISLSFDLHGQITDKIIDNINSFTAYKTAPHSDVRLTYLKSAKMLSDILNKKIFPKVIWSPIPILVSGEMSSTLHEPCKSIYKEIIEYQDSEILDVSLMIGYVWADCFRATAASVITCVDLKKGKNICKLIALKYWQVRNKLTIPGNKGNFNDFLKWLPNKFSILADSGDNPTAGGVGDRCDVLKFLIKNNIKDVLIASIASPSSLIQLKKTKNFTIGGTLGGKGPKLNLHALKVNFINDIAIVSINSITIIITKKRQPFHFLKDFKNLNIELKSFKLLVVKSGYLSSDLNSLFAPNFMLLSKGAVNQNLLKIENKKRMEEIYPFQKNFNFIPNVR